MLRRTKALCAALTAALTAAIGMTAAVPVLADTEARNIAADADFSAWGDYNYGAIRDDDVNTYAQFGYGEIVRIKTESAVSGVYLKFYLKSAAWSITAGDKSIECGQNGFVHEFVDLSAANAASTELSLTFPRGASVCELALYTDGTLPADVQRWDVPLEGSADLLMFSSHADDEQLFFSGVLPDAVAKGAAAQVVYFCSHSDTPQRVHEQLNGLWAVGVRYYPVLGGFPDLFSESRDGGYSAFAAQGYNEDDFLEWQVENIRRFKPKVLVIHDADGEYGHGTHIINSETSQKAIGLAADSSEYPFSLTAYGTWDTPKVYMHLYKENEIILDFDKPLDFFGGKSAYEMSCLGFAEHKSQHWTWFYNWMYGSTDAPIEKASEITTYSPCRWGLWRSTVGSDTEADMFDNIVLYKRDGDDTTSAGDDTQNPSASTGVPSTTAPAAPGQNTSQWDFFRDSKVTKILVGCAAVVVAGMIIALIASAVSSHREAKDAKRRSALAAQRSEAQARSVREARDARLAQYGKSGADNAAAERSAAREAQIRAARESRESGSNTHDKPGDKKY